MDDSRVRLAVLATVIAIVLLLGLAGVALAVHQDTGSETAAPTTTTTIPARGVTTTTISFGSGTSTTSSGSGTTTTFSGSGTTTTTFPSGTTTTTFSSGTTTTLPGTEVGGETLAMTGRSTPMALVVLLLAAAVTARRLAARR